MKKTLILVAALVSLAACNKAVIDTPVAGEGFLSFSLNADDVLVSTKAVVADDKLEDYNVILAPTQDGQTGWTKTYAEVKGETFILSAGHIRFQPKILHLWWQKPETVLFELQHRSRMLLLQLIRQEQQLLTVLPRVLRLSLNTLKHLLMYLTTILL